MVHEHGHCGRLPEEVERPNSPLWDAMQLCAGLDEGEGVAEGLPDLLEPVNHTLPNVSEQSWSIFSP